MPGHDVDAPKPVMLLVALGGMDMASILGMFVGATSLALGYQIVMGWVRTSRAIDNTIKAGDIPPAG